MGWFEVVHRRVRFRNPARHAAHPRLPRGSLVGTFRGRRHRPRRQDAGRRLRLRRRRNLHRQRLDRPRLRGRRDRRRLARARLRLDRPARQPDRLRHGHQHGRRRTDGADRQRHLVAGRTHAGTAVLRPVRHDRASLCPSGRSRSDHRPDLRASDLGPRSRHLSRISPRAADLLGALQHPVRVETAGGGRKPGGRRHRRHFGESASLQRCCHLRRPGGPRGRLPGAVAGGLFPAAI